MIVSTHSRPKAAGFRSIAFILRDRVSTHSRPKAAGNCTRYNSCSCVSFNTQPPEGGWSRQSSTAERLQGFQHTAARRRLAYIRDIIGKAVRFQHTAARRRLVSSLVLRGYRSKFQHTAARRRLEAEEGVKQEVKRVSTHSRPKAAGRQEASDATRALVSTHSRPKAAGKVLRTAITVTESFNTQPPEGGWIKFHTQRIGNIVSTHSRPKAAG